MLTSGARLYVSHATQDQALAEDVGLALGTEGHEVFAARDALEPGQDWREHLHALVHSADIVLVLWTANGVASRWVAEEAAVAVELGKYVGVRFGDVELPHGFARLKHAVVDATGSDLGPVRAALTEFRPRGRRSAAPRVRAEDVAPPAKQVDVAEERVSDPSPAPETQTPSSAPDQLGYDVFISYSRKEPQACELLFQLLSEAGLRPWYDKDIGSGQFKAKIVTRISKATVFVLLLSKHSVGSPNVRKELGVASSSQRWIIPISIDGITVEELEDTFKYELIELNVFSADPAIPPSWSDAVSAIVSSVLELRGSTALAVVHPPEPVVERTEEARHARPRGIGVVLAAAAVYQAAVGFLLYRAGYGPDQAVAGAVLAGAVVHPLAFATAWLARGAVARK